MGSPAHAMNHVVRCYQWAWCIIATTINVENSNRRQALDKHWSDILEDLIGSSSILSVFKNKKIPKTLSAPTFIENLCLNFKPNLSLSLYSKNLNTRNFTSAEKRGVSERDFPQLESRLHMDPMCAWAKYLNDQIYYGE